MEREIKFRVIINSKIFTYERLKDCHWESMIPEFNPKDFERWSGIVISIRETDVKTHRDQFTGIRDRNGKEIYENDIISYWPFNVKGYRNTIAKVPLLTAFHWFEELESMMDEHQNKCEVDIIGNIHENPELLK